jgi:hypothetical protein
MQGFDDRGTTSPGIAPAGPQRSAGAPSKEHVQRALVMLLMQRHWGGWRTDRALHELQGAGLTLGQAAAAVKLVDAICIPPHGPLASAADVLDAARRLLRASVERLAGTWQRLDGRGAAAGRGGAHLHELRFREDLSFTRAVRGASAWVSPTWSPVRAVSCSAPGESRGAGVFVPAWLGGAAFRVLLAEEGGGGRVVAITASKGALDVDGERYEWAGGADDGYSVYDEA